MIGRPQVTNEQSRCCVVLPEAKGEKGNMDILGTTRLLFVFLLRPFSSRFPFIFFLETIFLHGWYDSSSEGNPATKAIFRHSKRTTTSVVIKIPHQSKKTSLSVCYVLTLSSLLFQTKDTNITNDNKKGKKEH